VTASMAIAGSCGSADYYACEGMFAYLGCLWQTIIFGICVRNYLLQTPCIVFPGP